MVAQSFIGVEEFLNDACFTDCRMAFEMMYIKGLLSDERGI